MDTKDKLIDKMLETIPHKNVAWTCTQSASCDALWQFGPGVEYVKTKRVVGHGHVREYALYIDPHDVVKAIREKFYYDTKFVNSVFRILFPIANMTHVVENIDF